MPSTSAGGLGAALVGEKIMINSRQVHVAKLLGEGGFSYVYLVKELSDTASGGTLNNTVHGGEQEQQRSGSGTGASGRGSASGGAAGSGGGSGGRRSVGNEQGPKREMVLKVTSILSRQQRDIAEKEAKLLSRLSHPSIIKMFDTCYRTVTQEGKGRGRKSSDDKKERPQHLILMEFCEGGHALEVCTRMSNNGERFDLSTLIIAFGQICNAVSYLHAQRPPIVHRDLKPANFLVKNGAYKLCDFGSAVFGHVDLKTQKARVEAEEVIQKTTTQMFRAPEMVDLYMAKKLTQATDVWALGACLYSLAFLQNCFEEGSNLAILSRKYKIPDDNPYGDGLVELIDRMLTIDSKARADMTEVILCLSAVYSGRPLPPRKERSSKKKEKEEKKEKEKKKSSSSSSNKEAASEEDTDAVDASGGDGGSSGGKQGKSSSGGKGGKAGTFRTDTQGVYQEDMTLDPDALAKKEAKKLDPMSAAARRRAAAANRDLELESFHSRFEDQPKADPNLAFSTMDNPFASFDADKNAAAGGGGNDKDLFAMSFDDSAANASDDNVLDAFANDQNWVAGGGADKGDGTFGDFATFNPGEDAKMTKGNAAAEDDDGDDDDDDGDNSGDEDNNDEGGEENQEGGERNGGKREEERTRPKGRSKSGRDRRGSDDKSDRSDKGERDKEGRRVRRTRSGEKDGPSGSSSSGRNRPARTKSSNGGIQDEANSSKDGGGDATDDASAKRKSGSRSSRSRHDKDGTSKSSSSRREKGSKNESTGHDRPRERHKDRGHHKKEGHTRSRTASASAGDHHAE